jgi:UPF0176 protein
MQENNAKSFPKHLCNQLGPNELANKRQKEKEPRVALSFYKYKRIPDPADLRHALYLKWQALSVLGRVYVAEEGINAQVTVPQTFLHDFISEVEREFLAVHINRSLTCGDQGFLKLVIKIKDKLVDDGFAPHVIDLDLAGEHLSAEAFHEAIEDSETLVVDVRNHYESEVGRFEGALTPDVDCFREELKAMQTMLQGQERRKILLYCTGGIRCEKASAWLTQQGFADVKQLKGGIIGYSQEIKRKNLKSKFIGKNFVFDGRMGERVTEDVIAHCHICGAKSDRHINCAWDSCHILFITCDSCEQQLASCCSRDCQSKLDLPAQEQQELKRSVRNPPGFRRSRRKSCEAKGAKPVANSTE